MLRYECPRTEKSVAPVEGRSLIDFYSAASQSFEKDLDRIEKEGRRDSSEWHLAEGLLHLTQGLQQACEEEEDLRKCFARSSTRRKSG